eukprot:14057-Hanusia_phi.AAC.2
MERRRTRSMLTVAVGWGGYNPNMKNLYPNEVSSGMSSLSHFLPLNPSSRFRLLSLRSGSSQVHRRSGRLRREQQKRAGKGGEAGNTRGGENNGRGGGGSW